MCISVAFYIPIILYIIIAFFIKRESYGELGALVWLAVDSDFAVVQINNSLDYRQTEAVALCVTA